ncbi:MAG: ATP-dependent helicase [Desulfobacula sp.]|jgi:DNA helicase-2/ATP-dependent DNA helicase PcrA|nr:ATP-dependent helicase [Desulfobacula sp.]
MVIRLNDQQKAASDFTHGIACVIAVPGAGKTLTMSHRIGNLVKKGIPPESILGLTFTRNAALAMRKKLQPVLNEKASRVTLSTIHSFSLNLLKNEGRSFELLIGSEQIKFIKKILKKLKIRNIPSGMVLREIGLAKNNLITIEEFKALYDGDDTMMKISDVYNTYENDKHTKLLMDFNDLLVETLALLKNNKEVKKKYQNTYKHTLVDEFQDTNPAQLHILNELIDTLNKDSSFWACGDDWQSIFSFTGASVGNILNFNKNFKNSKQFILDMNYRSSPQILEVCQNLISHNTKKIEKTLRTNNPSGDEIVIIEASNEEDEGIQIINEIKDLTEVAGYQHKEIAVLYRANNLSRVIEDALKQNKVPYHIENGTSFYERTEVKVLLNYLRLINDPFSDDGNDALKNVVNIPNRYIGRRFMTDLEQFAEKRNVNLYQALKSMPIDVPYLRKYVKEFISIIDPLIKNKDQIEPSEMVHILREGLDYDRFIAEDDIPSPDDSKIENINQLQIAANKYTNIQSLLNYTDSFKEEQSKDKNGVSLMTIHKSKGLEFPVVFVIGWMEGVLPNKQGDVEEERRIGFVSMSRAMQKLYLSYPQKYQGRSIKKSRFLDEINLN